MDMAFTLKAVGTAIVVASVVPVLIAIIGTMAAEREQSATMWLTTFFGIAANVVIWGLVLIAAGVAYPYVEPWVVRV